MKSKNTKEDFLMKNLKEATCRAKSKSYQSAKGITLVALVITKLVPTA